MVDIEEHFLPGSTILSVGGVTLGSGSPFLVILVPFNCFSSATVLALYGIDLGGLAFPWLLTILSGTSTARPGMSAWRVVYISLHLWSAIVLGWSNLALLPVVLLAYEIKYFWGVQL